jgi:uroporphyrinogen-III decarboxylase
MMTRRERLMATLRGEPVDRPAVSFYEIGGLEIDPDDPDEFNVYHDPSWRPLLQLAEEHTDLIRMRSPVRSRSQDPQVASAHRSPDDIARVREYVEEGCRCTRVTVRAPGRILTSTTRRSPALDTIWTTEHLLKSADDLKAYLTLPDEFLAETVDVTPLIEEERRLGERGIVMVDTEDPICAAASLFSMEDFLVVALTEQRLSHRLLEKLSRPIHARTRETARAFPGHLWRIYGPEYAAEPYLPPHLFRDYVVRYTGPMVEMIQQYGGFARIHCHGRLRGVLDAIVGMGADAIDPIEPPPQGDVELADVRREHGKELVLFGNIEVRDIESMEPAVFERVVARALADGTHGTGRGFVLMPSAAPNGRCITSKVMANYETLVRLATGCRL